MAPVSNLATETFREITGGVFGASRLRVYEEALYLDAKLTDFIGLHVL